MAAQSGKDMLLKLDQTGAGSFLTVAGLRTRALDFNAASIDITDAESAGRWRELLAGGGIKRASVSGSGIFKDQGSDAQIRAMFFGGTIRDWQLILPDFGVISGPFQIVALEFSGDHAGEVTFDLALESAGELTFAAL
jgi:TP901-1 family phage major tail protein